MEKIDSNKAEQFDSFNNKNSMSSVNDRNQFSTSIHAKQFDMIGHFSENQMTSSIILRLFSFIGSVFECVCVKRKTK